MKKKINKFVMFISLGTFNQIIKYRLYKSVFQILKEKILILFVNLFNVTVNYGFMLYENEYVYLIITKKKIQTQFEYKLASHESINKYYIYSGDKNKNITYTTEKGKKIILKAPKSVMNKNGCYLFIDRVHSANDNAMYLYEYYTKNFPEIESYYVISSDYKDLETLYSKGYDILIYDTEEFAKKYKKASKVFSSSFDYLVENYRGYRYKKGLNKSEYIFLPHGQTRGNQSNIFLQRRYNYFITSCEFEKHWVHKSTNLIEGKILNTGYPRTDNRKIKNQNTILFCPTWEQNQIVPRDFSWIYDEKIISYLEKENLYFNFAPHHNLKYTAIGSNERIRILDFIDYNFEISHCKKFITDYSSVFTDLLWEGIPIYFIQESNYHYHSGLNYEDVGVVCKNIKELIKSITSDDELKEIDDKYLSYTNRQNCKEIASMLERNKNEDSNNNNFISKEN